MKKIIIFAAALLLGCSAMSAQNKGDMSVGGIFGFSAGASKTNITSNSTTVKGDNVPSQRLSNLTEISDSFSLTTGN